MQNISLRQLVVAAIVGVTGGAATYAQAATVLWTGNAGDNNYATGGNWVGGSPPAANTYTDGGAEFSASPTTITTPAYQTVSGLTFDTAGWTVGNTQIYAGPITSDGIGTNTLPAQVNYEGGTSANGYVSIATWSVGVGNTLSMQLMYLSDKTVILDGGGQIDSTDQGIWGYGTANDVNIQDATLQLSSATPYYQPNATGVITLENPGQSFLQLETSVANTESYFGNEIVGNGGTLAAIDLGNGYTEVALVPTPEPGTAGLLALATVGGLARRRRRVCV